MKSLPVLLAAALLTILSAGEAAAQYSSGWSHSYGSGFTGYGYSNALHGSSFTYGNGRFTDYSFSDGTTISAVRYGNRFTDYSSNRGVSGSSYSYGNGRFTDITLSNGIHGSSFTYGNGRFTDTTFSDGTRASTFRYGNGMSDTTITRPYTPRSCIGSSFGTVNDW